MKIVPHGVEVVLRGGKSRYPYPYRLKYSTNPRIHESSVISHQSSVLSPQSSVLSPQSTLPSPESPPHSGMVQPHSQQRAEAAPAPSRLNKLNTIWNWEYERRLIVFSCASNRVRHIPPCAEPSHLLSQSIRRGPLLFLANLQAQTGDLVARPNCEPR